MNAKEFFDKLSKEIEELREDAGMRERAVRYLHYGGVIFYDERSGLIVFDPMNW